ncbi:MAG: UDP-N-acetylmuramoyl-tripeptide--D-alanyl-D-alanine ligase [Candidatus Omnitrophota bacterium]|jgi:UDP-N-acetylmuramoyl-tripeptide--D-alanyl-D-alanine ligase
MRIGEIVKIARGRLLTGNPDANVDLAKVSTDSRAIGKGEFFIALKGPSFDGNDFVREVLDKGAIGAIVSRSDSRNKNSGKILIQVKDTTKALQDIAACHRRKFKIPVIAVTGSNGKTTTKDMVWSVLSSKYNVLRNEGTKNNHIGVPQTLLKLTDKHQFCVLELGTNHKGEIERLSEISAPDVAVITNIGASHLEFLNNLDGVCEEKTDILKALKNRKALAILNGDDDHLSAVKPRGIKIIRYGLKSSNNYAAVNMPPKGDHLTFVVNGKMVFELNLLGVHNIYNALAAIACGRYFGLNYRLIREALFNFRPTSMRLNLKKVAGVDIIDDTYNSNPSSMAGALDVIKYYPAKSKWVVAGDMLELGQHSERFHKMAGRDIARAGIDGLVTFGKFSRHILSQAKRSGMKSSRLWHCSDHKKAAKVLKSVIKSGDVVLLKGSRGMKMESVLEELKGLNV